MNNLNSTCRFRPSSPLLVFIVSLLLGISASPAFFAQDVNDPAGNPPEIRLMAWNLEWFPGEGPEVPLDKAATHEKQLTAYLAQSSADVLLFQEIVSERALRRAVQANPDYTLHIMTDFEDSPLEMAILSRYSAVEAAGIPYTITSLTEAPRGFAYAALRPEIDHLLLVCSIHLKSNRGSRPENYQMREEASRQIISFLEKTVAEFEKSGFWKQITVVVGGDFNSDPADGKWEGDGTWEIFFSRQFHWTWEGVPDDERLSWIGDRQYPPTCFDHILVWQRPSRKVSQARLLEMPEGFSDHRPVEIILNLKGAAIVQDEPENTSAAEETAPVPAPVIILDPDGQKP